MNALITQLKADGEDFEFYPTTDEIINALLSDVAEMRVSNGYERDRSISSVLDIGAGHGKVLRAFRDRADCQDLYAIEKSALLRDRIDKEVFVVGTDFHEQSLVSKHADVTFCNPPYSEFEAWSVKIVRESASPLVYLVIPTRWASSAPIADAIAYREAKWAVVGSFDFLNAEDREARAKVHLIRIELSNRRDDAFDRFFDEQFAGLKAKFGKDEKARDKDSLREAPKNPKMTALVAGVNYPDMLVALYNEEMDHIQKNYALVAGLDADLLRELNVYPAQILGGLKARLAGLRSTYWQELFGHMKSVTNRLTANKRRIMLERLHGAGHVDFTVDNIHAVLVWVMKNANNYIDEQLLETFDEMVNKANVVNYKSNTRAFVYDRWRYNEEKPTHIALEYRLVLGSLGGIAKDYNGRFRLDESAANFLGDLLTVAHGLGFFGDTTDGRISYLGREGWEPGSREDFYCIVDGRREVLFEVRAHLNRNVHIRLNQRFAMALNVEVGRLRGWVKSGAEAAEELGDPEAAKFFGTNLQLGGSTSLLLAA